MDSFDEISEFLPNDFKEIVKRLNRELGKMTDKEINEKLKEINIIPLFSGRPERKESIGLDDILNLNIALNTFSTFEEFFNLV